MRYRLRGVYAHHQFRGTHTPFTTHKRIYWPKGWWVERTIYLPLGFFVSIHWSAKDG